METIRQIPILVLAATLSSLFLKLSHAEPPGIINHQGRIAVGGVNFDGTGHFKFALVGGAGTPSFWSNDESSIGGGEPTVAIAVSVSKGHYAVVLGETSAIPAGVFAKNDDVRLRVWFSQTGAAGTFEMLTPDRRFTSSAYALSTASVSGLDSPDGNQTDVVRVNGSGGVEVGTSSSGLDGVEPTITPLGFETGIGNPEAIAVQGDFAYVADSELSSLRVFDISDPSDPSIVGSVSAPGAAGVQVQGDFAYLLGSTGLRIWDVSDPPNFVSRDTQGIFGTPLALDVSGTLAYVISEMGGSSKLEVFDVSDPTNIAPLGSNSADVSSAGDVAVEGNFAYILNFSPRALQIIDVSDPVNLIARDSQITRANPAAVAVQGGFAFVLSGFGVRAFDVSDPDNITIAGVSGSSSSTPIDLVVSGPYAYELNGLTLQVWDISDLQNIEHVDGDQTNIAGSGAMAAQGRHLFVGNPTTNQLQVFELGAALTVGGSLQIANGGVVFADGNTQTRAFGDNAVGSAEILNGSITGTDILDGTITAEEIGNGSITGGKLATGTITGAKLATGTISTVQLADGSVTSAKILDGTITGSDITSASLILNGDLSVGNLVSNDDDLLFFDTNESLAWRNSQGRFELSDDLRVNDGLEVGGLLSADGGLVTSGSSYPVAVVERTTSSTTGRRGGLQLLASTSGNMADTFGVLLEFAIEDSGAGQLSIAQVGAERAAGADGVGNLVFRVANGGSPATRMRLDQNGNLTTTGAVNGVSDRDKKENFQPVDPAEVLENIVALPIARWNYKHDSEKNPHLGPVAQDFHAAFGLGTDDKHIATVDADGVALAAIQALKAENDEKTRVIDELKKQNAAILERLEALERVVAADPTRGDAP